MLQLGENQPPNYTMPNLFDLDKTSLHRLKKFQRKFPREFQYATSSLLDTQAFELRKSIVHVLPNEFEIRNHRFMNSRVRVRKSSRIAKIRNQVSEVGSTEIRRFTGWIEQETGKPSKQSSRSEAARDGSNFSGKIKGKFKNNKLSQFKRPGDFKKKNHKTYGQAVVSMLENARASGGKRFIIEKGGGPGKLSNFKGREGLYFGGGGDIHNLHRFGEKWKPKRNKWMEKSLNRFDRKFNLKQAWGKQLDFRLKKIGAR